MRPDLLFLRGNRPCESCPHQHQWAAAVPLGVSFSCVLLSLRAQAPLPNSVIKCTADLMGSLLTSSLYQITLTPMNMEFVQMSAITTSQIECYHNLAEWVLSQPRRLSAITTSQIECDHNLADWFNNSSQFRFRTDSQFMRNSSGFKRMSMESESNWAQWWRIHDKLNPDSSSRNWPES